MSAWSWPAFFAGIGAGVAADTLLIVAIGIIAWILAPPSDDPDIGDRR